MAVHAPSAPTPPTPPSVPKVTLGEGGSTTQTNGPHPKQVMDEEAQARASVAQGNGKLSRTTTVTPEEQQEQEQAQQEKQQTSDAKPQAETQSRPADTQTEQVPNAIPGMLEDLPQERKTDLSALTAGEETTQPPLQTGGHGTAYWLFSAAAVILMLVVIVQTVRKKKGSRPQKTPVSVQTSGQTAEAILRAMDAQEKAPPVAAAPAVARQYQSEAARAARSSPQEAPRKGRPGGAGKGNADEEIKHFEVRV